MARILIRPEDLARLARHFDATADDLTRSVRRISRDRENVAINRADDSFPANHFAERSRLVESNLGRLAAEFRVDGALAARTVDDAEFDDDARWTAGLTGGVTAGGGTAGGVGAGGLTAGLTGVGPWNSVAAGLRSLEAGSAALDAARSATSNPAIGAGGLFRISSASATAASELLDRLAGRLEDAPFGAINSGGGGVTGDEAVGGAVWSRIMGELFAVEDDP